METAKEPRQVPQPKIHRKSFDEPKRDDACPPAITVGLDLAFATNGSFPERETQDKTIEQTRHLEHEIASKYPFCLDLLALQTDKQQNTVVPGSSIS
jgi:hypothetical protein